MRGTLGGKIELVALRSISLGEEVTYYGDLSSDDFLLDYGFLPSDPPIPTTIASSAGPTGSCCPRHAAPQAARARAEWQSAALHLCLPRDLQSIKVTKDGLEDAAMAACRVAAASDAAALRGAQGGKRPLPPAGEVRALKIAAAVCALALSGFPEPEEGGCGASRQQVRWRNAERWRLEPRDASWRKSEASAAALEELGERIKALQTGRRGLSFGAKGQGGERRPEAVRGTEDLRAKAGGFGASSSRK